MGAGEGGGAERRDSNCGPGEGQDTQSGVLLPPLPPFQDTGRAGHRKRGVGGGGHGEWGGAGRIPRREGAPAGLANKGRCPIKAAGLASRRGRTRPATARAPALGEGVRELWGAGVGEPGGRGG